jgi:hypothetical protein
VVQGIVLVTFPAASTIFTDPDQYDLSNTQYGLLFLPQVVTAIAASVARAGPSTRTASSRLSSAECAARPGHDAGTRLHCDLRRVGFWWDLPVTSAVLLSALIVASLGLALGAGTTSAPHQAAAFGVGPLLDAGVTLRAVYAAAAGIAVAMGLLSFRVTRREQPR